MNLLLDHAAVGGGEVAMVASKYFISQGELFAFVAMAHGASKGA